MVREVEVVGTEDDLFHARALEMLDLAVKENAVVEVVRIFRNGIIENRQGLVWTHRP